MGSACLCYGTRGPHAASLFANLEVRPSVPAPCPPMKEYYSREAERRTWVGGLFDRTAGDYDRVERAMALGTGSLYRRRALRRAGLTRGMFVVDVGVGTGLVAREAARLVGDATHVTGVDPSSGMVEQAKVPPGVRLMSGSAEAIPLRK